MDKIYDLPAGQKYVATPRASADYYWAKVYTPTLDPTKSILVKDSTQYYQLDWNHRFGFVKASDVDEVPAY
jgi:hypothetical protein